MDAQRRTRAMADGGAMTIATAADPQQQQQQQQQPSQLSFALRQAALRCLERHKHTRVKPFDHLLMLFALYFADPHAMPFCKILFDSQFRVPFRDPGAFLRDVLESGDAELITACLAETRAIANAAEEDDAVAKAQIAQRRERRHLQGGGNKNKKTTFTSIDSGNNKKQQQQQDNDDDTFLSDVDADEEERDYAVELSSFFRIAADILEHGLAVARNAGGSGSAVPLHAAVADEAAELVAKSGGQIHKALAALDALSYSDVVGVDAGFYGAVASIARLMHAQQQCVEFVEEFRRSEEPPAPPQKLASASAGAALPADGSAQQQRNALQSAEEAERIMNRVGEHLDTDEFAFGDEVQLATTTSSSKQQQQQQQRSSSSNLLKPERFAKVITGYGWSNYNRARYSYSNPPPKQVQAYEFTLFYPELPDPTKTPRFEVRPTENGWNDDLCFIEFDAGPPYQKVAYRIVNKKWDKGKWSCTFDPAGRFRLYFRFESSGYKR